MRMLRQALTRIGSLVRGRESDFDAELQSHLDLHIADNIRAGMTREEARRQALIALGGVEQTKERYREQSRWRLFDEIARDIVFAARLLVRDRSFTFTAAFVLGIGIAVTNTFFILTNAIVIRGVPIDDVERVLILRVRDAANRNLGMSYQDYRDIRAAAKSFTGLAAYALGPMTLGDATHAAERFEGAYVASEVFGLVGERPLAGRDFRPEDEQPGAPAVVILGRSIWESRYGGTLAVVGSTLRVNGVQATVIGIMADRSKFPTNAVVWQPLGSLPGINEQSRSARTLTMFGRLRPSATYADANGEMQSLWSDLRRRLPEADETVRLTVRPINEHFVGPRTDPAWLALMAAGFLVLSVACANVANLLIMRGTNRTRELAVRTSLGATRARIARQLLSESVVLAFIGGMVGLVLSILSSQLLWISLPEGMLPHWMHFTMDPPMFGLLAAVCLASSVVFGVVPAFQLTRGNLSVALNSGVRGTGKGVPSRRLTGALLVAQSAVALGSLISISAAARNLAEQDRSPRIDMRGLLTMSVALPGDRYRTHESRLDFLSRLNRSFGALNQVTAVAFASAAPLGGAPTRALILEGQEARTGARPTVRMVKISPGYFETLGIPLLRGRTFTNQDGLTDRQTAIVNQRFAELHFRDGDPIGRSIALVSDTAESSVDRFTIVAVSPSIRQRPVPEPDPVVYVPHVYEPQLQMAVLVRASSTIAATASLLRASVHVLDPDIPLHRLMSLEEASDEANWNTRFSSIIASVTGVLAVLLSAIGIYALTSHGVARMTPEIGIRAALGARPHQVLWRVMRRATVQLILGIAAGIAFAVSWDRLFGVGRSSGVGPVDFFLAALMLLIVSYAACLVPAIRALRINPIDALRYE